MSVDLNDVVRVVLSQNMPENSVQQIVWHYIVTAGTGGVPGTVLTAIETAAQTAWANIAALIDNSITAYDMELFQRDTVNEQWDGIASKAPSGLDGTVAHEMMPHGAAAFCKIKTVANRRQSRKFISGWGEGTANDGLLSSPNIAFLLAFAAAFDVPVTAGPVTLTYCTYNTKKLSPLFQTASQAAQAVIAEGYFGYQRRRKPGVGLT